VHEPQEQLQVRGSFSLVCVPLSVVRSTARLHSGVCIMGMLPIRQMARCSTLMFSDFFMSCNQAMTRLFVSRNGVTYEVKKLSTCNVDMPYIIRFLSNNPVWTDWDAFIYHVQTDCKCFLSCIAA